MAGFGKLVWVVARRSTGRPIQGATVEVRSQGAQVNGAHAGATTSFTVDEPGAVVATNTVKVNTGTVSRSVSSITATTVVVGGPGFSDAADDDRITIASPLPTIYNDSQGNETKTNPLTTDANGYVDCWIVGGKYDLLVTADGTETLYKDIATTGGESATSNVYNGGSSVAWIWNTLRALVSGDKIASFRSNGVEKASIAHDGAIAGAAVNGTTGTFSGAVTSVGLANTGVMSTTTDFTLRRLKPATGTALSAGSYVLTAAWGTGASVSLAPFTQGCTDQRGGLRITTGTTPAAFPQVAFNFVDGAWATVPYAFCCRYKGAADQPTIQFSVQSTTVNAATFTFMGTPVAGETYDLVYWIVG